MILKRLVAVAVLGSVGCVHASGFWTPEGRQGFVIRCGGRFNDMAACYNRAHEECGGPYRIVNGTDDQRVSYNYVNGQPMVVDHRELTVICGG